MERVWTLSLSEPWYMYVKLGKKIYEGRLLRGISKLIKVGDFIEFFKEDSNEIESSMTQITKIHKYEYFIHGVFELGIDYVLPNIKTIQDAEVIYESFASINSQKKYGVVFFKVDVLM